MPQLLVVQGETQGLYQMQAAACVGAETNDVARVGGNLRLVEDHL